MRRCLVRSGNGRNADPCFILLLLITAVFLIPALGPTPVSAQTELRPETEAETDLIHFGDIVDVDVVGNLEYDWRGSLTPEGFLDGMDNIPEPIYALCKSEPELAAAIRSELRKILRDPVINVKILDRSRRAEAIVMGAVRTPYRFQIHRPVYLNELLALSGGITDRSSGEISIFRPRSVGCEGKASQAVDAGPKIINAKQDDGSGSINIRITDLLAGKHESNPVILSGDIVTVVEAQPIFVIGGVNNPRQLSSRSQITLSRAIASCGGISKEGQPDHITIFRRSGRTTQNITADLDKIKDKKAEDIVLRAYDIVDVGQKGRPKRRFAPSVAGNGPATNNAANLQLRIVD